MIGQITLKICGITRAEDAVAAAEIGADWLGFIFYPPSPRNVTTVQFDAMRAKLPPVKKVAVCVEPSPADLAQLAALGFEAFQIHFQHPTPLHRIGAWAETVGVSRLWLAPKLPPSEDVSPEWLPFAQTFLLDTFHAVKFGGTGETGDWAKFKRHTTAHTDKTWILSGGLNPDNIAVAVTATVARFVDINSGVESAPGIKHAPKLAALGHAIGEVRPAANLHSRDRTVNTAGLNLLIPEKPDAERDALAAAFSRHGGQVHKIARFWEPPAFEDGSVRVYGPDAFCLVLQQKLSLTLTSPADDLLLRVDPSFTRRRIVHGKLSDAQSIKYPAFIKPIVPKQFRGITYTTSEQLLNECKGLPPDTSIMVSEVVIFEAEVRCFLHEGRVLDAGVYEGDTAVSDSIDFANALAQAVPLPNAVVIDVGLIPGRGWAVIEFNAAWGSGLNGCSAEKILPAVLAASGSQL